MTEPILPQAVRLLCLFRPHEDDAADAGNMVRISADLVKVVSARVPGIYELQCVMGSVDGNGRKCVLVAMVAGIPGKPCQELRTQNLTVPGSKTPEAEFIQDAAEQLVAAYQAVRKSAGNGLHHESAHAAA